MCGVLLNNSRQHFCSVGLLFNWQASSQMQLQILLHEKWSVLLSEYQGRDYLLSITLELFLVQAVLDAHNSVISAIKPGVSWLDMHK